MNRLKQFIATMLVATFLVIQLAIPQKASADELTGKALEKEMRAMIEAGVLTGYTDGTYKPAEKVTRAQFAAFISRALELPEGSASFTDVSSNMTLAPFIYKVTSAGIMGGYSDNTFKPDQNITREQMMLAMQNVLTYSEMALTEKRIDFTDMDAFGGSVSIKAAFIAANYDITSGFPNADGTVSFQPKADTTREQAAAFIYRFLEAKKNYVPPVVEEPGEPEPPLPPPVVKKYKVATVQNNQLVNGSTEYETYDKALAAYNANTSYDAITFGVDIIKTRSGAIAYGNATTTTGIPSTTTVYFDQDFAKQATYIEYGREMRYYDSNDKFIKVQVGATIGYVKHSQTELKPAEMIQPLERDRYSKTIFGSLAHTTYNHAREKIAGTYINGPAPDFMQSGATYYSYDGIHFMNDRGTNVGAHVPYFQYLSIRALSSYSAEEIDAYIVRKVQEKFPDTWQASKLIGIGATLKKMETEQRVNALMILSLGINESNWGMSKYAQKCNNLFGLYVNDTFVGECPAKGNFPTIEDGVRELVISFFNTRYSDPTNSQVPARNMGAAFGNKTTGFNVNYASDPTWGAKAAGHLYTFDQELGGKDFRQYKKIAFTNLNNQSINVRTAPTTASNILFTYRARNVGAYKDNPPVSYAEGYPLTIVEEKAVDGYTWYKVYSDWYVNETSAQYGWIRGDLLSIVEYP
ncbi:S-layer homology domain-containing protein [Paenisporosarcina cavernae]|uniref:S-layer homology domain-containing protein n=1 Tax=Paenisporosarcina cavernae TaxID=2320858 RepID=UPI0013C45585|nr:S-layer homology domain-containing protein [Paenisporosarcina cavernae]